SSAHDCTCPVRRPPRNRLTASSRNPSVNRAWAAVLADGTLSKRATIIDDIRRPLADRPCPYSARSPTANPPALATSGNAVFRRSHPRYTCSRTRPIGYRLVKKHCNRRRMLDSATGCAATIAYAQLPGNRRMVPPRSMFAPASDALAEDSPGAPAQASQELQAGSLAPSPHIDPKYLYDRLGSRLFTGITLLPQYYPTRCEAEILQEHAADIAAHAGKVAALIDVGAGDCVKAERLFASLQPRRYVPIDISAGYLQTAVQRLQHAHPDIEIMAVCQDVHDTLDLPHAIPERNRLFFYPGSSIGNLDPGRAARMLARIRAACPGGGLLVGVD